MRWPSDDAWGFRSFRVPIRGRALHQDACTGRGWSGLDVLTSVGGLVLVVGTIDSSQASIGSETLRLKRKTAILAWSDHVWNRQLSLLRSLGPDTEHKDYYPIPRDAPSCRPWDPIYSYIHVRSPLSRTLFSFLEFSVCSTMTGLGSLTKKRELQEWGQNGERNAQPPEARRVVSLCHLTTLGGHMCTALSLSLSPFNFFHVSEKKNSFGPDFGGVLNFHNETNLVLDKIAPAISYPHRPHCNDGFRAGQK